MLVLALVPAPVLVLVLVVWSRSQAMCNGSMMVYPAHTSLRHRECRLVCRRRRKTLPLPCVLSLIPRLRQRLFFAVPQDHYDDSFSVMIFSGAYDPGDAATSLTSPNQILMQVIPTSPQPAPSASSLTSPRRCACTGGRAFGPADPPPPRLFPRLQPRDFWAWGQGEKSWPTAAIIPVGDPCG